MCMYYTLYIPPDGVVVDLNTPDGDNFTVVIMDLYKVDKTYITAKELALLELWGHHIVDGVSLNSKCNIILTPSKRVLSSESLKLLMFNNAFLEDGIVSTSIEDCVSNEIPNGVEIIKRKDRSSKYNYLGNLKLPESLLKIDFDCFKYFDIFSIKFNNNLRCIDKGAFSDVYTLSNLDLSQTSVYTINKDAFKNCMDLNTVLFSNKLRQILDFAFYGCNIYEVCIPESCSFISNYAFYCNKNLRKIEFLGFCVVARSFLDCPKIEEIIVHDTIELRDSSFGELEEDCEYIDDDEYHTFYAKRILTRGIYTLKNCEEDLLELVKIKDF